MSAKPRGGGWYDWPESGNFFPYLTGQTVHVTERDQKPVLYDAKGRPLTYERRRIGFRPPRSERP